jgi:hypothetical protein
VRRLFVAGGFLGDGGKGSRVIFSEALREAILKSSQPQSQAAPYRPKKAALNWVDYLVIAATVLTFGVVLAVNNPHAARAQSRSNMIPANVIPASELPVQTGQLKIDPDLMRAKIGLATSRPWG